MLFMPSIWTMTFILKIKGILEHLLITQTKIYSIDNTV